MPELPEVENVKRSLEPRILGRTIERIDVHNDIVIKYNRPDDFVSRLVGRRFEAIQRRGKFLIFDMVKPSEVLEDFIVHLGMTGALLHIFHRDEYSKFPPTITNHIFVEFHLDDHSILFYSDYRRFGSLRVVDDYTLNYGDYRQPELSHLKLLREMGPEPFDEDAPAWFLSNIRRRTYAFKPIKDVLLDQRVVAGIGNIYANEACFKAGVNPFRQVSSLSDEELLMVLNHAKDAMALSVELGGTSIKDYVNGLGASGSFQEHLMVYNQSSCKVCSSDIIWTEISGRATFYCPTCQKT